MPSIINSTPIKWVITSAWYSRVLWNRIIVWDKWIQSKFQYDTAESYWRGKYIFTNIRWEKSDPMTIKQYIKKVLEEDK